MAEKRTIYETILPTLPLLLLLFAGGCAYPGTKEKESVAVSILPLKYLADRITEGDFEVTVLVPPGTSPETYEPPMSRMKDAARARACFLIGLIDFEAPFAAAIRDNSPDARLVDLSDGLSLLEESSTHDGSRRRGIDPHIWLSPTRMKQMAVRMAETCREIRPDSAGKYRKNLERLISGIDSVDSFIRHSFNDTDKKELLIFHPFLTYYAADYGLEQVAVEQEGKDPSSGQMKSLVETIRAKGIATLFYQEELHRHPVEALVQESGLNTVPINPLCYDWGKNMKSITEEIRKSWER